MGNCSLLLPTLFEHLRDPVAQSSSVTSSSPPFVPTSSLSKRPFGTWSLMTWQCSSVKLIPLLQTRNATTWTGLFLPPSRPSVPAAGARGQTCACISVEDSKSRSSLPGVSCHWTASYERMFSAFNVYWLPHWFFQKPKVALKNHVWKCLER